MKVYAVTSFGHAIDTKVKIFKNFIEANLYIGNEWKNIIDTTKIDIEICELKKQSCWKTIDIFHGSITWEIHEVDI